MTSTPRNLAPLGEPAAGTTPAPVSEVKIRGASDYANVLLMLTIAHRTKKQPELRVSKTNLTLLEGKDNWETWRKRLANLIQPVAGGRLWHLMLQHPATSVEAYRHILSTEDGELASLEEAIAVRTFDLADVANALNQTLTDVVSDDVNPPSEEMFATPDGQVLWSELVAKFAGQDITSLQAAENDLSSFKLGARTALDVGRDLQAIFSRIYNAGGGLVPEHRKIGAVLKCYTETRLDSTRVAIQESWSNKVAYTFNDVVKRFVAEEDLRGLVDSTRPEQADGARALRIQNGPSHHRQVPSTQQQTAVVRSNNFRRNKNRPGVKCHWCNAVGHFIPDCRKKQQGHPPHPESVAASRGWTSHSPHQVQPSAPTYPQHAVAPYALGARVMAAHPSTMYATALHASHFAAPGHPAHTQPMQGHYIYPVYAESAPASSHYGQYTMPSLANRISEHSIHAAPSLSLAQRLSEPSSSDFVPGRPY
ncbi:hypothetical protein A4X13_0g4061 [Tilletia indica]|uniref:CCHC-type domain-containing protein n=1 Tax=Tilletia indica TaxID=43049 RepID=A0A177T8Y6_9BASI|nr:hypothetical protein A4X13_0g4061 [Tilletia indica]